MIILFLILYQRTLNLQYIHGGYIITYKQHINVQTETCHVQVEVLFLRRNTKYRQSNHMYTLHSQLG